jgi:hypothetical protein
MHILRVALGWKELIKDWGPMAMEASRARYLKEKRDARIDIKPSSVCLKLKTITQ